MNLATVISLVATIISFGLCDKQAEKQNVVARVANETLSLEEIMDEIPTQIRANLTSSLLRQYVLRWVNNQVLYQEGLKLDLHQRSDLKKEFERLRVELLVNKLLELTLDKQVSVSDQEIEMYFEANKEEFQLSKDMVHAYHVCVDSKQEANAIGRRLKRGEAFPEILSEIRSDSSVMQDWDLGYLSRDEIINSDISRVMFSLPKGAYSYPIKSESGYHIVKSVDKRKKGETMALEMVRDAIRLKLEEKKRQENHQRFLLQAKSNFEIQTNFQLLDSVVLDSLIREGA